MKKIRHSIIIMLSLMVFITSSGMAVNLHYCAGELQNISFNGKSETCLMQAPSTKEVCSKENSIKKMDNCCQDHQIQAKTDQTINNLKVKTEKKEHNSFTFISEYFSSLFSFSNDDKKEDEDDNKELSIFPLLKSGLYILLQNFRN